MPLAVNYDLHNPGRHYPKTEAVLKKSDGGWAHLQGSFWIIDTSEDCATWRDRLAKLGDANDEFFVGLAPEELGEQQYAHAGGRLAEGSAASLVVGSGRIRIPSGTVVRLRDGGIGEEGSTREFDS